jgi:hypothetical protein
MISLVGGDTGTQIALMQIQSGQAEEEVSQDMRKSDEAAEVQADDAEYNDTESKATAAMWSGIATGVGEAGEGGFSIAAASASLSAANSSAAAGSGNPDTMTDAQKAAADAAAQATQQSRNLAAYGQLTDAVGKGTAAVLNGMSIDDGADAEKAKEAADHAKTEADDASDFHKDEHDAVDKAITFAGDYDNALNQENQAAMFHRA